MTGNTGRSLGWLVCLGCATRGGNVCSKCSSVFPLVLAPLWDCRIFMGVWLVFSFESKILTFTFNLCRWLITINQFSVLVLRKSPAQVSPLVSFLISLSPVYLSVLNVNIPSHAAVSSFTGFGSSTRECQRHREGNCPVSWREA